MVRHLELDRLGPGAAVRARDQGQDAGGARPGLQRVDPGARPLRHAPGAVLLPPLPAPAVARRAAASAPRRGRDRAGAPRGDDVPGCRHLDHGHLAGEGSDDEESSDVGGRKGLKMKRMSRRIPSILLVCPEGHWDCACKWVLGWGEQYTYCAYLEPSTHFTDNSFFLSLSLSLSLAGITSYFIRLPCPRQALSISPFLHSSIPLFIHSSMHLFSSFLFFFFPYMIPPICHLIFYSSSFHLPSYLLLIFISSSIHLHSIFIPTIYFNRHNSFFSFSLLRKKTTDRSSEKPGFDTPELVDGTKGAYVQRSHVR